VREFRSACGKKRSTRQPELAVPADLQLELGSFAVLGRKEQLGPALDAASFSLPDLSQLLAPPERL